MVPIPVTKLLRVRVRKVISMLKAKTHIYGLYTAPIGTGRKLFEERNSGFGVERGNITDLLMGDKLRSEGCEVVEFLLSGPGVFPHCCCAGKGERGSVS